MMVKVRLYWKKDPNDIIQFEHEIRERHLKVVELTDIIGEVGAHYRVDKNDLDVFLTIARTYDLTTNPKEAATNEPLKY